MAIQNDLILADLSQRNRICVLGSDRQRFLNGQVTNNIRDLKPGQGCYTLMATNKGMIQGDARVYCLDDELLLDLEPQVGERIVSRLTEFIVADDVEIVDVAQDFSLLTIQGSNARDCLQSFSALADHSLPDNACAITPIASDVFGEFYVADHPRTGTEGFDIFVETSQQEALWNSLLSHIEAHHGAVADETVLDQARIQAGIPRFPIDMEPSVLAPELGIEDRSISYAKGCFVGQEVINRIRSIGKVNRIFVGFTLPNQSAPIELTGSPIVDGEKKIGFVTSATFLPEKSEVAALGIIKTTHQAPGTEIGIRLADESVVPAKIRALPPHRRSPRG